MSDTGFPGRGGRGGGRGRGGGPYRRDYQYDEMRSTSGRGPGPGRGRPRGSWQPHHPEMYGDGAYPAYPPDGYMALGPEYQGYPQGYMETGAYPYYPGTHHGQGHPASYDGHSVAYQQAGAEYMDMGHPGSHAAPGTEYHNSRVAPAPPYAAPNGAAAHGAPAVHMKRIRNVETKMVCSSACIMHAHACSAALPFRLHAELGGSLLQEKDLSRADLLTSQW